MPVHAADKRHGHVVGPLCKGQNMACNCAGQLPGHFLVKLLKLLLFRRRMERRKK